MTDDKPSEVLTSLRDLTRQVRAAQRATWFPLLVFALLSFGVIPVAQHRSPTLSSCSNQLTPTGLPEQCAVYSVGLLVYWSVGLVLAYVAIAAFYRYRARRRGVGSPVLPYVLVGVVFAVLAMAITVWSVYHPGGGGSPLSQVLRQLHSPPAAIALALLVLAWVEGNAALTWFSLAYLVVVLIPSQYLSSNHPGLSNPVPRQLILAGVLLLGSLGFALVQRGAQRDPQ